MIVVHLSSSYIELMHSFFMSCKASVGLSEELEPKVWDFFTQHICVAIEKYQVEGAASTVRLTAEKFESMLCELVADAEAPEV